MFDKQQKRKDEVMFCVAKVKHYTLNKHKETEQNKVAELNAVGIYVFGSGSVFVKINVFLTIFTCV